MPSRYSLLYINFNDIYIKKRERKERKGVRGKSKVPSLALALWWNSFFYLLFFYLLYI
jgi:hypothetical protein